MQYVLGILGCTSNFYGMFGSDLCHFQKQNLFWRDEICDYKIGYRKIA